MVEKNGLNRQIKLIKAKVEEVDIPEKADCVVSEWLGVFGVQENMLPSVASAGDRFLKLEGKMLPEKVRLFLSLVEDNELYDEEIGQWTKQPYGLDYTNFASCQANDVHVTAFTSHNLLSNPLEIIGIDMKYAMDSIFDEKKRFKVTRNGICHGLAGWFQAVFPGGIILDTTPGRPLTHWRQAYFPIPEPVRISQGEEVLVRFTAVADNEIVHFIWELSFLNSDKMPLRGDTRKVKFSD